MKKKFKSSWLNFSLLALLLVSSSTILTACQNLRIGPEAIKKDKEEKANKKKEKENSTKPKPAKSNPTPGKDEDTQMDDDPE